MPITAIIAIVVILLAVWALAKQYETRLVLLGAGLLLCLISFDPLRGLRAFSASMTNSAMILAICGASGFAYAISYTKADRCLVYYISRPIKNLGIFLIPIATIITFLINIAIPAAVGCGAIVGATLIPVLLRAGITPAGAATAILGGTVGSLLSPGLSHNAFISEMAGMSIVDLIAMHAPYSIMVGAISAVGLLIVCWFLGDHKGERMNMEADKLDFTPNPVNALVPLIPIIILVAGTFWFPELKIDVAQAMLIGSVVALLVALCINKPNAQDFCKEFFRGMGNSYGAIMGIIVAAGVFAAGITASGLVQVLIDAMIEANDIARWAGSLGPFVLSVIVGSGDAGAMAFNQTVTPHAAEFNMTIEGLGSLAFIAGAAGRTASPISGACVMLAAMAGTNPLQMAKRTFIPMTIAAICLALFMG